MKPIIGITSDLIQAGNGNFSNTKDQVHCLYNSYIQAVTLAGGIPIIINSHHVFYPKILNLFDGLILSGGDDIKAEYFGEKQKIKSKFVPEQRIDYEMKLLRECIKQRKPILGICYGMQLINVYFKGTLYQDINKQYKKSIHHKKNKKKKASKHFIKIFANTKLNRIWKKKKAEVNTYHHQAVKKLGKGLMVSARASDSIVEAIEAKNYPFLLGVQWHPEKDINDPFQKKLFCEFIKAANKKNV